MALPKLAVALTAGLSVLAFTAAQAQPTPRSVSIGQVVRGDLSDRDSKRDGEAPYDEYLLRLKAGEGTVITLDSEVFDPAVAVGQGRGEDFQAQADDDDSGGGERGLNSRLRFKANEAGEYVVRVNTIDPAGRGAYTLALTALPPEAPLKVTPITVGRTSTTTQGALTEGGARRAQEPAALFDRFTLQLRQGDVLMAKATSDFDNLLTLSAAGKENEEPLVTDDDSGGDGDARIYFRVRETGAYSLDVSAFDEASSGPYALVTQLLPPPPTRARVTGIRRGQTIQGKLDTGDAVVDDTVYRLYDLYELRGRAGETVTIRLTTPEGGFDPILAVGGLVAGRFALLEENDDELVENAETEGTMSFNSKLSFTFSEGGAVLLRAAALLDGATGDYSISVD
jgi:hypothetical protein